MWVRRHVGEALVLVLGTADCYQASTRALHSVDMNGIFLVFLILSPKRLEHSTLLKGLNEHVSLADILELLEEQGFKFIFFILSIPNL